MVAFLFYVQRFFDPIRSLTMQYSVMQRAMAAGQRIFEVLDVPVDVRDKPGRARPATHRRRGRVQGRDLRLRPRHAGPARTSASGSQPGETVALVGPTGSGKTSTMALVHRFYDVWSGQVLVGGHDVRDLTQASLGRHIGMVLQEPFLFTGTVFENIRYASTGRDPRAGDRGAPRRSAPTTSSCACRRATTRRSSSAAATSRSASAS